MTHAEEARRLVDKGRVVVLTRDRPVASASVQGDRVAYRVHLYSNNRYFCACPWGLAHHDTDNFCVHALAVKLAVEREAGDA